MKLHRGIPCLPALLAHPGFSSSAALGQPVSITTEEEKPENYSVAACRAGWSGLQRGTRLLNPPGWEETPENFPPTSLEGNFSSVEVGTGMSSSALTLTWG